MLFCVTTAIVYFYVAAWSAAAGKPYWLPMICCMGYLVVSMQDRVELPALHRYSHVRGGARGVSPSTPQQGWLPIYVIGIALVVFAPTPWIHGIGRTLTAPARNLVEERSEQGIDERASQVFYLSLLGLVVARC